MRRVMSWCVVVLLWASPALAQTLSWPASPIAAHARAWFEMLAGDEALARKFMTDHMAPAALAEVGVDERLARRKMTLERTGGLTPLEVLNEEGSTIDVRCRAGNGDLVVVMFQGEEAAPHRLTGVRIEASGPGEAPMRPAGPRLEEADAAKEMTKTLDDRSAAGTWSGTALFVRDGRTLVNGAWGLADREKGTPNAVSTRFNVGSIGKLFTRTAVAQLAEAGKLSLDDKLSRYLPDFPHADSITIAMLCAHRSGVGDIFNEEYRTIDRAKLRHNHDYLQLIRNQPLWFEPGTSERYSNGGYVLLGEVIAKASGEDYYDYLAKHVYGPAGMTATGAPLKGDGSKGLAVGYTLAGAEKGERDNDHTSPARGSAAGGSFSTTADLLAFDRALLGNKLCGAPWSGWVVGGPRPDQGGSAPSGPPGFGFAGGAPGVNAEWTHDGDAVLIVLTNRDPDVARPTVQALRDVMRRLKPAAKRSRL